MSTRRFLALLTIATLGPATGAAPAQEDGRGQRSPAQVVAAASDQEWRALDPDETVYFELPNGSFVVELAPWAAPRNVENLKAMVRAGLFDGGAVVRSQDNYVAQWSARPLPEGGIEGIAAALPGEREFALGELPFTPLPDADTYAPEVGFTRGFPAGRDPGTGMAWLVNCYSMINVARGNSPDSGNASSLAAISGHAPRHLDRQSSMIGRVIHGMEHLTTLPRGTGNLGFYETESERVPILSARIGSDLPPGERVAIELMRTDSTSFHDYVMAYRARVEEWFVHKPNRVGLCNVRVPTRPIGGADTPEVAAAETDPAVRIRARRSAFNDAIAAHDAEAALTFVDREYQITTGAGENASGDYTESGAWDEVFARADDIVYVRTPERVEVATPAVRAFESGVWRGSWTAPDGPQTLGGRYTAHWRLVDGEWVIRSEIFVTLWCNGPECP